MSTRINLSSRLDKREELRMKESRRDYEDDIKWARKSQSSFEEVLKKNAWRHL